MPVAAVFGRGDVAQDQRMTGKRLRCQAEGIVGMAHGGTSFVSFLLLFLLYCLSEKKQWSGLCKDRSGNCVQPAQNRGIVAQRKLSKISKMTKSFRTARYIKYLPRICLKKEEKSIYLIL
jgi:hypothetical protein